MTPAHTPELTRLAKRYIAIFSALTLAAGAGGMAISFLYLASRHPHDVFAGAVGFVAGAVLLAAGLLSLAIQSRSQSASEAAIRATACLVAFLPPLAAVVAWPALYFAAWIFGLALMPFVLIACVIWAWLVSDGVAGHLCRLLGWSCRRLVRGCVFAIQIVGILASWPLFGYLLDWLDTMGVKTGWS